MSPFRVAPRHAHLLDPAEHVPLIRSAERPLRRDEEPEASSQFADEHHYTAQPPQDAQYLNVAGTYRAYPHFDV